MLRVLGPHSEWDAFVTWRSEAFARSSRDFSVHRFDAHATGTNGLFDGALVLRSTPAAKDAMTRVLGARVAFPTGAQETSPVRFVERGDDTHATKHETVTIDSIAFGRSNLAETPSSVMLQGGDLFVSLLSTYWRRPAGKMRVSF